MQDGSDNRRFDAVTADGAALGGMGAGQRVSGLPPQARIGHFVILYQLGVGGMGTVFAAFDTRLDRKVALKIVHNQGGPRDHQNSRTLREAKALARVKHPRVVSVYDVAESESQVYLAMEFVDGIPLRKWQSQESHTWREILQMYLWAGAGLCAIHQSGIIHRDFKPDNVLVDRDGLPIVVDFGIARLDPRQTEEPSVGESRPLTSEGVTADGGILGTVGYMSPEQYSGEPVDAASDQWSFCAALHEALYGQLPTAGLSPEGVGPGRWGGSTDPRTLPKVESAVPTEILRILCRGLSRQPSARYPNMGALLHSLAAELEQSAAAGTLSRRTFVVAMSAASSLAFLFAQYMMSHRARIVPQTAALSVIFITIMLLAGYRHRATLRRNPFHRAMWSLLLTGLIENLFVRVICLSHQEIPASAQIPVEMIVWGGVSLLMTLNLIRRMWWVVAVPLCFGVMAAVVDPTPRRVLACGYPMVVGLLLWQWWAAARRVEHNGRGEGEKTR